MLYLVSDALLTVLSSCRAVMNIHGIVMNIDVQRPPVLSSCRAVMNIHGIVMNIDMQRPPVLLSCRAVALSTPEDGAHTSLWSGSLASRIYGLTDWCLGRTDLGHLAADERWRTGTCTYGLVPPPGKLRRKKWKTRGELSQKMRRNSGKLRQNYLYFTVQFLSKVIAVKTQQTSTCPYRLVLPAGKLCRKKW